MALLTPDQVTQIASNVGFPPALANGIAGQESGYGSTSPNVAQITPSTAADPGYGMAPLSPTDMADPSKNLAFALDLARRKVMAMGKDPNDPANAPLLAQAQNGFGSGAGDPAYYQHVMNRMGYQGALGGTAGPSSFGNLPNPTNGPFQGQPLPAMPAGFGTPSQPPVQAPQVQQPGGASNPLVALGLGLAGGNGWHDGIAKGGAAYQDALALQQKTGADNAQLQEQTNDLNAAAPDRAAQAASLRADAWKALNPVVTPDQAATLNLQARGQDVQAQDAQAQLAATAAYRQFLTGQTKTANTYVDRGADGTASPTFYTQTIGRDGQVHVTDANGNPATLPATATTQAEDQRPDPVTVANVRANTKAISDFGTANQAALDQDGRFNQALAALQKPGANLTPGIMGTVGRGIDNALGTNLTGNLTDTQVADAMLKQDMLGQFAKNAKAGGGRGSDALRAFVMQAQPHLGQDPQALVGVTQVLQAQNQLPLQVADIWAGKDTAGLPGLTEADRTRIVRGGSFSNWVASQKSALMQANPIFNGPSAGPATAPSATATPPQGNPLVSTPTAAPAANAPASVSPMTGKTSGGIPFTFTPGG